jgi:hypothetical protein
MIRITRRDEPPSSLAAGKSYNGQDVQEALVEDFFNKCYLCEGLLIAGFDVEHLKPKSRFPDHELDWKNLFPAHPRCNGRRKKWNENQWPEGGLLDCAVDDIEGRLDQQVIADGDSGIRATFESRSDKDIAARNSAEELSHLHQGSHIAGWQILSAIERRYKDLHKQYKAYLLAAEKGGPKCREAETAVRTLAVMLKCDTPYAGLMRDTFRRVLPNPLKHLVGLKTSDTSEATPADIH